MAERQRLSDAYPEIAAEWDYEKNGGLTPEMLMPKSNARVWWICKEGHSWQAAVCDRTGKRTRCPYCAGSRAIPGKNDLTTLYPEIAAEWHPDNEAVPSAVLPQSNKRVKWRCAKGHVWEARVQDRTMNHHGCPYCTGKRAIKGKNDLATLFPELAEEWSDSNQKEPSEYLPASNHRAIWKCRACGQEWKAIIANRTRKHDGCPYCSGRLPIPGKNDLATLYPHIASEWHPTRNGRLRPQDVTAYSDRRVWWQCSCGHEWRCSVYDRVRLGRPCKICGQ